MCQRLNVRFLVVLLGSWRAWRPTCGLLRQGQQVAAVELHWLHRNEAVRAPHALSLPACLTALTSRVPVRAATSRTRSLTPRSPCRRRSRCCLRTCFFAALWVPRFAYARVLGAPSSAGPRAALPRVRRAGRDQGGRGEEPRRCGGNRRVPSFLGALILGPGLQARSL